MSTTFVAPAPRGGMTAPPKPQRRFRADIQGLRAIAVLLVVLYHAGVPGLTGGYVGVDVFFVISGFLITSQLVSEAGRRGKICFTQFYGRRMRRLLPPAALVMVLTVVVARLVLPVTQAQSVAKDVFFSAFYAINYRLAVEGVQYQNATAPPSPLQHFWSLAVEEQFYIVWPLLIALCLLVGRQKRYKKLMLGAIVVLSAATLLASIVQTPHNSSLAYFSIHTRAWELGAGAVLALAQNRLTMPQWVRDFVAWGGIALIVGSAFIFTERTLYPGSAATLPVAGASAVLAAGTLGTIPSLQRVLGHGAMQYMGKVSYAWYLWHWPLLILLPAWAGRDLGWGYKLEIVFLAFWAAVLTYFLENAAARHSLSLRGWIPVGVSLSSIAAIAALTVFGTMPNLVGSGAATVANLASADVNGVQAAMYASHATKDLPSNLSPGLADAPNDKPVVSTNGCSVGLTDTKSSANCLYGDPNGSRVMVLVGDSHAEQWFPGLNIEAKKLHYRLYSMVKHACPIAEIGTVWNNDLKRAFTECDTWRASIYGAVKRLKPDIIVSSQADGVPWTSVTDEEWANRTVAGLQSMRTEKTSVVYFSDVPLRVQDPITCLEAHMRDVQSCNYATVSAYSVFPNRHKVMSEAIKNAGWTAVDTLPLLCTSRECPAIVGNMVTFRDTGHLTATYSAWLAPVLAPIFKEN